MNTTTTTTKTTNQGACPLCSKTKGYSLGGQTFECASCGAIHGTCYLGDSYSLVKPFFGPECSTPEEQRYFDLTCLGSRGVERRHGWFNPATKTLTQVG